MADFGDALTSAENQLKSRQTAAAGRAFRKLFLRSPGYSTILASLANVAASHRQNGQIAMASAGVDCRAITAGLASQSCCLSSINVPLWARKMRRI